MISLLDNIRKYSQQVLLNSTTLSINTDKVEDLEKELELLEKQGVNEPFMQNEIDTVDKLGLTLFFNVVNFCFKDPLTKKEYKYKSKNGDEIGRSTGLFQAMQESGIKWRNFNEVAKLTNQKWLSLSQISQENPLYLGPERHNKIVRFADYLIDRGYQNPIQLLEKQRFEVGSILEMLVGSNLFEDNFLKRAQVSIRGMEDALVRDNATLKGIGDLTCMADYRIPQLFYNLNVINLDSKVLDSLLKLKNIEPNSDVEISLRASVIVIGKTLSRLMNRPEFKVDIWLWKLSQKLSEQGKLRIPHMIVATDKY